MNYIILRTNGSKVPVELEATDLQDAIKEALEKYVELDLKAEDILIPADAEKAYRYENNKWAQLSETLPQLYYIYDPVTNEGKVYNIGGLLEYVNTNTNVFLTITKL